MPLEFLRANALVCTVSECDASSSNQSVNAEFVSLAEVDADASM